MLQPIPGGMTAQVPLQEQEEVLVKLPPKEQEGAFRRSMRCTRLLVSEVVWVLQQLAMVHA